MKKDILYTFEITFSKREWIMDEIIRLLYREKPLIEKESLGRIFWIGKEKFICRLLVNVSSNRTAKTICEKLNIPFSENKNFYKYDRSFEETLELIF